MQNLKIGKLKKGSEWRNDCQTETSAEVSRAIQITD